MSRHPIVKWAQRSDVVFITIELPDAQNVKLNLEPDGKFQFSATAGPDKSLYEVNLDLFDKVDVNESQISTTSRSICYLVMKEESKWWSRLVKQEGKPPLFLKVDWEKWVDEDEQDEQGPTAGNDFGNFDFSKLNMDEGGDLGDDDVADDGNDLDEDDGSDIEDETKETTPAATSVSPPTSANGEADTKS